MQAPNRRRSFLRIAALMTVVVVALILLTREGLLTLSGIRAFSSGAARWVHAEKEVIHHLGRYVRSPNGVDWAVYEANMEVLHASRHAIEAARDFEVDDQPAFYEAAERLGHTPRDAGLLLATRDFVWRLGPLRRPLEIWFGSDSLVRRIEAVAREVGPPDVAAAPGAAHDTTAALDELAELDGATDRLLRSFTTELSRADHLTRQIILAVVGVAGLLLLAGALGLTYRTLGQMERSEEERERTQARLQMLLKQTPLLLWTTDHELVVRSINGGDAEGRDLVGTPLPEILETTTRNENAIKAHRAALEGRSSDYDTTWRDHTFSVHVEPLKDPEGKITGTVGVALDVTNRAEVEEERARLEEQFREAQKMEAVGRLAGGIAHDFNNLLTVIRGNATLLRVESGNGTEELAEIDRAAEKARRLTRQLLAFSRREPTSPRIVHVDSTVAKMEGMLRSAMGEAVELSLELDPDAPPVRVDPGQFEQVVLNLALNARQAMPDGGKLRISTRDLHTRGGEPVPGGPGDVGPGTYLHLRVADDGCGIRDEDLPRIFEPFFSTRDPSEGSGLGLAMVYGVVKQADGFVWAESRPGRGTRIHVLLPTVSQKEEAAQPPDRPERISSTS